MKAYFVLVPLAVSLVGCTVYRPTAFEPVYTSPPAVAYVTPPNTVIMGAPAANWNQIDSDSDGYANSVDRFPYDGRLH